MFFWPGLLVAGSSLLALIDDTTVSLSKAVVKHWNFILDVYDIRKKVASTNQVFLLMSKSMYQQPYTTFEQPWKTYRDVKQFHKAYWPYLNRLDNTTAEFQTLSNEKGEHAKTCINMSSYSYLGILHEDTIRDYVIQKMIEGNYCFGNHGPRMLGGNNYWICELEKSLAKFTSREAALCFSSGFLACKSAIQSVVNKRDVIFADSRIHESLRDGVRVARSRGVQTFYFQHNNMKSLDTLLYKHREMFDNAYIVVESVYSMDGDIVDLQECKLLADKYDARIILDEAHGMGVLGDTGRGAEEMQDCVGAAWMICGSLTKSFGTVGGYICGSSELIDFLHFFASGTMFSAPMSVPNAIAGYKALKLIRHNPGWILEGREKLQYLKESLKPFEEKYGVEVKSDEQAPLIAFIFHNFNPAQMMAIATYLGNNGFYVASVNPPACKIREPRFRLTASRLLTYNQIDLFVYYLRKGIEQSQDMGKQVGEILNDLSPVLDFIGI